MPCGCFGKKDKKCGVVGEEEKYRPRDSRERELPVSSLSAAPPSQSKPLLAGGADPTTAAAAPGTPPTSQPQATPTTPGGGSARLRPEDDPDKATRRRDVVASFYSDQCELIGFKTTSSRPSSTHVGSNSDGPAATSSPAASSPASTRSLGACCRADLAEKRREFFKDLAIEDETRSRPTSRLTDPGSQVTPRNSHYQDQRHHTLPHLNKTSPRSNKFSSPPLFLQHSLKKTPTSPKSSTSQRSSSFEDTQPLLHSSPELSPKTSPKHSVTSEIPSKSLSESSPESIPDFQDEYNENVPLLSEKDTEVSLKSIERTSPEIKQIIDFNESNSPNFQLDLSPSEYSKFDVDIQEVNDNSKLIDPKLQDSSYVMEKSVLKDALQFSDFHPNVNTQVFDNFTIDSQYISDNSPLISSSPKVEVFAQHDAQTPVLESTESNKPFELDLDFSSEPFTQTHPVIVNEYFKENLSTPFDTNIVCSEGPDEETIVKTTRQFISVSPDESKTSQTIIETTRQFISGTNEEDETPQTIVETTQQFLMGSPDEQRSTQTIVETTRQFISGIQDDEGEMPEMSVEQFLSGSPNEKTLVKTMEQFVYGSPEEQMTQTIVQTTKQFMSGSPDEQITQTTVETTQQSLPPSFFLTSAEEPEELPEKFILQSSTMTHFVEAPVSFALPPEVETIEEVIEELDEPKLPGVPCFGAPPPPSSPPPPLPEGEISADFTLPSLDDLVLPPGKVEPLPPAPPTPPAEQVIGQPLPTESDLKQEQQQQHFEAESEPPYTLSWENEDLPPAPPTPPTPRLNEVQQQHPSTTSPAENEILPPTPPTPPREDDMPPTQLTPAKDDNNEHLPPAPPTPPISSSPSLPPVTCGVELVSSSPLEDDGLGSEIDDALETLEGLSDEGNIERAAASS